MKAPKELPGARRKGESPGNFIPEHSSVEPYLETGRDSARAADDEVDAVQRGARVVRRGNRRRQVAAPREVPRVAPVAIDGVRVGPAPRQDAHVVPVPRENACDREAERSAAEHGDAPRLPAQAALAVVVVDRVLGGNPRPAAAHHAQPPPAKERTSTDG